MWQLARREGYDQLPWLVLALLVFVPAAVWAIIESHSGQLRGWDRGGRACEDVWKVMCIVSVAAGGVLAYLLGQSQVRAARRRGLSDHLTVLPVGRLTVDLVRTAMGLALLLVGIGLPVGVVLAWLMIADVRPVPLYWDDALGSLAWLLTPLLLAYAGGLCFGRGSVWRALFGVPVVVVLEWYCRGQAVVSVELARVLAAGGLAALALLADRPRALWPRRIVTTALVVLVWQTPLAVVRAWLDRSPSCLWGNAMVVLDGAGNPHDGSGNRLFWRFADSMIPAYYYARTSAKRTRLADDWWSRRWMLPTARVRAWLNSRPKLAASEEPFDFLPKQHPALWVRDEPVGNAWTRYEVREAVRAAMLGWRLESLLRYRVSQQRHSPPLAGYRRGQTLAYPNRRTGLVELHELLVNEENRRVRRITAYAGRHEVSESDKIEPFPAGTVDRICESSGGTLLWLGPDETLGIDLENRRISGITLNDPAALLPAPNSSFCTVPWVLLRLHFNALNLSAGLFNIPWSSQVVVDVDNPEAIWDTPEAWALARARMRGDLGPPPWWSTGRALPPSETGYLFWRVQPDDLGQWYEVTVPGPWCPFVNLVQFTLLSQDGSPGRPVRTAHVWLDPGPNDDWLGPAEYIGGCVLATLSPPAVLLSSLVMPPAYTPQEWQQCVFQEPLISALRDKRFDQWVQMPGVHRNSDVKHVRLFMASIATPILLWSVGIGSLLGWHVKRRHRPHQKRSGEARRWFLAVLLLGIPGWIVYRIYRPREALVNCPRCGRLRSPATVACPFCNAPWTSAERLDTEIVHAESPAVVQT